MGGGDNWGGGRLVWFRWPGSEIGGPFLRLRQRPGDDSPAAECALWAGAPILLPETQCCVGVLVVLSEETDAAHPAEAGHLLELLAAQVCSSAGDQCVSVPSHFLLGGGLCPKQPLVLAVETPPRTHDEFCPPKNATKQKGGKSIQAREVMFGRKSDCTH